MLSAARRVGGRLHSHAAATHVIQLDITRTCVTHLLEQLSSLPDTPIGQSSPRQSSHLARLQVLKKIYCSSSLQDVLRLMVTCDTL